jgi:hypothetical protein
MNKQEFYEGIKKIENAYNTKFERDKLNLWYSKLKEMEYQEYLDKIDELITTKKYIPNIAEILEQQPKFAYQNYDQRDYKDIDFDSLYAN